MTWQTMYKGLVNSPETTITNNISESDTIIYVLDPARVPELPNLMTLGTGTNAETVLVTAINDNGLTVQRGFQGIAKAWPAGTVIARNFTEYDYDALKSNVEDLEANKETPAGAQAKADAAEAAAKAYADQEVAVLAGEGRTTETVKGNADALAAHLADETNPHNVKAQQVPLTQEGLVPEGNVQNIISAIVNSRFNIFPCSILTSYSTNSSSLSLPCTIFDYVDNHYKNAYATGVMIINPSDGTPTYMLSENQLLNPSEFGRGFYIVKCKKESGNWKLDGNPVSIGSTTTAGLGLSFDVENGTIINKGNYVTMLEFLFLPVGYEKYLPYTTLEG